MYFFLNLFHSCIFGNSLEKRKNNSFLLGRMRCTSPAHARKQARSPFPSLPSLPSGPRRPRDPAVSCWPSTRAPPVGNASPKSPLPCLRVCTAIAGNPSLPCPSRRLAACHPMRTPPRSPCPLTRRAVASWRCGLRKRCLPPVVAAPPPMPEAEGSTTNHTAPPSLPPILPPRFV
jgi:hypothetical protein